MQTTRDEPCVRPRSCRVGLAPFPGRGRTRQPNLAFVFFVFVFRCMYFYVPYECQTFIGIGNIKNTPVQNKRKNKSQVRSLVRPLPGNGASPTLQLLGPTRGSSRVVCIYVTLFHSLVEGAPILTDIERGHIFEARPKL